MIVLTSRVCPEMLDPEWAPLELQLMQAPLEDEAPFETYFRCPIKFGHDRNALIVKASEFDQELPTHNPELITFLSAYLCELDHQSALEIEDLVARSILEELSFQPATATRIAEKLGMSTRTLQRQLRDRQTSFSEILKEVRLNILLTYSKQEKRAPFSKLAKELGFSDASAASRFMCSIGCKQELGCDNRRTHFGSR